jgi:WD40 repeat protein
MMRAPLLLTLFVLIMTSSAPAQAKREAATPTIEPLHWILPPTFEKSLWTDETLGISPNGGFAVERAAMGLRLWKLSDNTLASTLHAPAGWDVKRPAFASEREVVVVNDAERKLGILDVFTGKTTRTAKTGMDQIFRVRTGGNTLLIEGTRAEIWNLSTLKKVAVIAEDNWPPGRGRPTHEYGVSHDGSIVYSCAPTRAGNVITMYDGKTGKPTGGKISTSWGGRMFGAISADGQILVVWDKATHFYNGRTGEKLGSMELGDRGLAFDFDRTTHRLLVRRGQNIRVIDASTRTILTERDVEPRVSMLIWGPGSIDLIACGSEGGVVRLSYPELKPSGEATKTAVVTAVALSHDGSTIFTGDQDGRVTSRAVSDPEKIIAEFKLSQPPKYRAMDQLIPSADGKTLLLNIRSNECAVLTADLKPLREFRIADNRPHATSDLATLVTGAEDHLLIIDGQTGKTRHRIEHGLRPAGVPCITPDDKRVLVGDNKRTLAYDLATGERAFTVDRPGYDMRIISAEPPLALLYNRNLHTDYGVIDTRDGRFVLKRKESAIATANVAAMLVARRELKRRTRPEVAALAPAFPGYGWERDEYLDWHWLPEADAVLRLAGYSGRVTDWYHTPSGRHIAIAAGDGSVAVFDLLEHLRNDLTLPKEDLLLARMIEDAPAEQTMQWVAALAAAPTRIKSLDKLLSRYREPLLKAEADVRALADPSGSVRSAAEGRLSRSGTVGRAAVAAALLAEPDAEHAGRLRILADSLRLPRDPAAMQSVISIDQPLYVRAAAVLALAQQWTR